MEIIEIFKVYQIRRVSIDTVGKLRAVPENITKQITDSIYGPILDSSSEILIWNLLHRVSNITRS